MVGVLMLLFGVFRFVGLAGGTAPPIGALSVFDSPTMCRVWNHRTAAPVFATVETCGSPWKYCEVLKRYSVRVMVKREKSELQSPPTFKAKQQWRT